MSSYFVDIRITFISGRNAIFDPLKTKNRTTAFIDERRKLHSFYTLKINPFSMYLATVFTGLLVIVVLVVYWLRSRKNLSKPRICILVLGDIGRSPRMQYHALSCAKAGYHVDLVGFGGI